jgi:hypothetical protein
MRHGIIAIPSWFFEEPFMEDKMSDAIHQKRRSERRVCTHIAPPPYQTRNGMVLTDRRSAMDRRSTWIREFSLETFPGRQS